VQRRGRERGRTFSCNRWAALDTAR
jgi:hypothetical protein